jgi:hypothetical protein
MTYNKLILFASIVGLGFQATAAFASCGDYVSRKGASSEKDSINQPANRSPMFGEHNSPSPTNHPAPCDGPLCSEGRLPPVAPISSNPLENDQWAWEMMGPREFFIDPSLFPIHIDENCAILQSSDIFHPPRCISFGHDG